MLLRFSQVNAAGLALLEERVRGGGSNEYGECSEDGGELHGDGCG